MNDGIRIGFEILTIYGLVIETKEYIYGPKCTQKKILGEKIMWTCVKVWFVIYNFYKIKMISAKISEGNMEVLSSMGNCIIVLAAGCTLYNSYLRDYKYSNSPKERKRFVRDMIILTVCISILTGIYLSYSI